MSYKLVIKKSAAKALEALPNKFVKPITGAILDLANTPRPIGCKKLKGKQTDIWRIRVGNYRVLYEIDDEVRIIDILDVGHRKDIYE
jgi:mRNA interferase RelE/StbE